METFLICETVRVQRHLFFPKFSAVFHKMSKVTFLFRTKVGLGPGL